MKLATSLDGRFATASGESRWITGHAARQETHRLRAVHSAVMVGVDTVIADDPELTVRLDGYVGFQPLRIVLDSHLRMPSAAKLVKTAHDTRTLAVSIANASRRLTDAGVEIARVAELDGRVDPRAALEALSAMGQRAIMIEGGGQVAASFLAMNLVDNVEWFRAPIILGDEGLPAIGSFVLKALADAPRLKRVSATAVGDDLWERYERA